MAYLKKLQISGYKKFQKFSVEFNPDLNILIGENSAGKSTILEAIEIVLNQKYFNYGFQNFQQQLNIENIKGFFKNNRNKPEDLPFIEIEAFLDLDNSILSSKFNGQHYSEWKEGKPLETGIKFRYEFDPDFKDEFDKIDFSKSKNIIPLEYYHAQWTTFEGSAYKWQQNPLKSSLIDNSNYMRDVYGSYAKHLYDINISDDKKRELSLTFKEEMNELLQNKSEYLSINKKIFSFDDRRIDFKDLLDIKEGDLSIQSMGSGRENLIKTSLSLNTKAKLLLIEEPENHLSYSNTRKQVETIQNKIIAAKNKSQIILTTHESLILNRLNLKKAIWIQKHQGMALENLPEKDIKFFIRNDNFDILRFILANKIILVEGASEFIALPSMIEKITGKDMDDLGVEVISMSGIHYKHFIKLAEQLDKCVLILTDNDGKKVQEIEEENSMYSKKQLKIKIYTPCDEKIFTFESAIYNGNEDFFKKITPSRARVTHFKSHKDLPIPLAYSLNHKTATAIKIAENIEKGEMFNIPSYIKEGVKWLEQLN